MDGVALLRRVVADLEDVGARFSLVGGFAVSVRIALKLLSTDNDSRPMDAVDLRALRDVATAEDWRAASDAVMLIETRGFHRNRDLTTALQVLRDF